MNYILSEKVFAFLNLSFHYCQHHNRNIINLYTTEKYLITLGEKNTFCDIQPRNKMCFPNLDELINTNTTNLKTKRQEHEGCFASLCTAVLFVISPKHYQYFTTYNACNQSTMDQLQRQERAKRKERHKRQAVILTTKRDIS